MRDVARTRLALRKHRNGDAQYGCAAGLAHRLAPHSMFCLSKCTPAATGFRKTMQRIASLRIR